MTPLDPPVPLGAFGAAIIAPSNPSYAIFPKKDPPV